MSERKIGTAGKRKKGGRCGMDKNEKGPVCTPESNRESNKQTFVFLIAFRGFPPIRQSIPFPASPLPAIQVRFCHAFIRPMPLAKTRPDQQRFQLPMEVQPALPCPHVIDIRFVYVVKRIVTLRSSRMSISPLAHHRSLSEEPAHVCVSF